MPLQSDIADILGEMVRGPITSESKLKRLLRHFAARGTPLATCAEDKYLGRKINTLRRYARKMDLVFPDYIPMHLRPKEESEMTMREPKGIPSLSTETDKLVVSFIETEIGTRLYTRVAEFIVKAYAKDAYWLPKDKND